MREESASGRLNKKASVAEQSTSRHSSPHLPQVSLDGTLSATASLHKHLGTALMARISKLKAPPRNGRNLQTKCSQGIDGLEAKTGVKLIDREVPSVSLKAQDFDFALLRRARWLGGCCTRIIKALSACNVPVVIGLFCWAGSQERVLRGSWKGVIASNCVPRS